MNSTSRKIGMTLVALLAFTFGSGFLVSKLKVEKDGFGKNKRFAIVSVSGTNKIRSDSDSGGLIGGLKAMSKKNSFSADGTLVLNDGVLVIEKELARSKHFKLVPSSRVVRTKAYQKLKADQAKSYFGTKMIPAKGFKYFKSKSTIKSLAKELNVDGAIIVNSVYSVGFSGATVGAGVVSTGIGKQYGMTMVSIVVVDKNGNIIWQNAQQAKSDKGVGSAGGAANFKKMHPFFMQSARNATRKLLKKLDGKLGA